MSQKKIPGIQFSKKSITRFKKGIIGCWQAINVKIKMPKWDLNVIILFSGIQFFYFWNLELTVTFYLCIKTNSMNLIILIKIGIYDADKKINKKTINLTILKG